MQGNNRCSTIKQNYGLIFWRLFVCSNHRCSTMIS
uniref:Uncharacterized protein n=1 Tax=Siphoviridae sp. ctDhw1 TaxID=2827813 RepID=A0A8S5SJ42_9CAUD|nr:MAG TPA: hypothetical protein [Siphoviridae sp. ctDhw1]